MHTSTLTQTHMHHSNKNKHICKHRPQTEASSSSVSCCFLIRVRHAPWSNLSHSENLQCRLSSFRCLLGGQDGDCIIYDEANRQQVIGTKQTREQPLVPERKQSNTVPMRLVTPHDTSFHFNIKHCIFPCWEPRRGQKERSFRIGGPKGVCQHISSKCWCKSVAADLSEKRGVRRNHDKHFSRWTGTPLSPPLIWRRHCFPQKQNVTSVLK